MGPNGGSPGIGWEHIFPSGNFTDSFLSLEFDRDNAINDNVENRICGENVFCGKKTEKKLI